MSQKTAKKTKTKKVTQRSMEDVMKELSKARETVARLEKEVAPNVEGALIKVVSDAVKSLKVPWDYIKQLQFQRDIEDGNVEPNDVCNDHFQIIIGSDGDWTLQQNFDEVFVGKVSVQ